MKHKQPKHGTYWGYCSGCRCAACTRANTENKRLKLTNNGCFGVRIGARWAAISVQFLHPYSMEKYK